MVAGQGKKEMKTNRSYGWLLIPGKRILLAALAEDSIAGWPNHSSEGQIDYAKELTSAEKAGIADDLYRTVVPGEKFITEK